MDRDSQSIYLVFRESQEQNEDDLRIDPEYLVPEDRIDGQINCNVYNIITTHVIII